MDIVTRSRLLAKPEVRKVLSDIQRTLRAVLPSTSFGMREEAALVICNEVARGLLEEDLRAMSDGFGERVRVDGIEYKRHELGTVAYYSLTGPLHVPRSTYRQVGVHNGPTIVPMELEAGIVEGATPALAYNVAHGYAQQDMRLHGESLDAAHRIPPPRATLERLAKRLGAAVEVEVAHLESAVRRAEKLPEGAHAIAVGLDRTSVPMAEERPADAPPKPEPRRTKPRERRPPPPFDVAWRMAYVGTVSVVDAQGTALVTRCYAAPACDDPAPLVARMCEDVRAARRRGPALHVGIVQDGAPEMWNAVRAGLTVLRDDGAIDGWNEGIDRCHLMERLGKALEIVEPDAPARRGILDEWSRRFDCDDVTIDRVRRYFEKAYVDLPHTKQQALWEHLVYLRNNDDRMRYVSLAVHGLPVGSGVTESAAKLVVGRRAKNNGQRWSQAGLRGVLTLRALHRSDRLPAFWARFARGYATSVEAA